MTSTGVIPDRAEQGLHDLATDIRNALRKHDETEVKTTESNGTGVTNIINNYAYRAPVTRYSFVRTATMILFMTALVVGTYMVLNNPHIINDSVNWFSGLFR